MPVFNDLVLPHFYVLLNPFVFGAILYEVSEHVPAFEPFFIRAFTKKCLIAKIRDDLQSLNLVLDVLKFHSLNYIRLDLYGFVVRISYSDFPGAFWTPDLNKITVLDSLAVANPLIFTILVSIKIEVPLSSESLPNSPSIQLIQWQIHRVIFADVSVLSNILHSLWLPLRLELFHREPLLE